MSTVICPACGVEISLNGKTREGEIVDCSECTNQLEVVKKGPRLDVELIDNEWTEEPERLNLEDFE